MIQGEYESDGMGATEVVCSLKRGTRKRVKCDGKDYKRISEHVGKIPLVMLSPADSQLVTGGSEERRRFMDMVISQYDATYLNAAIRYERTLKQRNALLKAEEEPDRGVMDVLEEMMGADAEVVFNARRNFVEEFPPSSNASTAACVQTAASRSQSNTTPTGFAEHCNHNWPHGGNANVWLAIRCTAFTRTNSCWN